MQFHLAGLCFTDASGVAIRHDLPLLVLSCLVAVCGSYTTLEVIERWRSSSTRWAPCWQLASAAALGGSIWSMHFIALLALRTDFPVSYATGPTALSLIIAIVAVNCGLQIMPRHASWARAGAAGTMIGLGIAAMHYIGMSGLHFSGTLAYTPALWGLSVLVGMAAATVAMRLSVTVLTKPQQTGIAAIMGLGICSMHQFGMAATVLQLDPLISMQPGVPGDVLGMVVAPTTFALILFALFFVSADRRLQQSEQREAAALRRANAELELGREQFRAAVSNMTQGLTFFDKDQLLVVCNPRYREIYQLPPELVLPGTKLADILQHRVVQGTFPDMTPEDYLARRGTFSRAGKAYDVTDDLRNGQTIAMHYEPLPDGGWVATHEDVTERRRTEANLVFMARHDMLTRLPNRTLFHERLEQAIAMAGRGENCAVLCLDLDHFKLINDTLGHAMGDILLQAAANRLQACVREVDTVARLGGDEFAIIQLGVKQQADVDHLARRVIAAFRKPFDLDGHAVAIGASIGAAIAPADGSSFNKLMKNADIALYLAKTEGRGMVRFYERQMDTQIETRRILELDLRGALARDEFEIHYQPLVQLSTGRVAEFEALVRWRHPERGLVPPAEFIPLAEETGTIVAIGEWVLRTACFEATTWPDDIIVAVNLSPLQFRQGDLLAQVQSALADSGLPAHRLELEITESVLLQESESTLAALHQLRALGIAVALDDFGTGYSSLSYLRRFPFDKIKIDQSFVSDMATSADSMSIVRGISGLGHSLHMKTTAEGVETVMQLDMLRAEGCTQAQGYFISRPKPASEIPFLLERLQVPAA